MIRSLVAAGPIVDAKEMPIQAGSFYTKYMIPRLTVWSPNTCSPSSLSPLVCCDCVVSWISLFVVARFLRNSVFRLKMYPGGTRRSRSFSKKWRRPSTSKSKTARGSSLLHSSTNPNKFDEVSPGAIEATSILSARLFVGRERKVPADEPGPGGRPPLLNKGPTSQYLRRF